MFDLNRIKGILFDYGGTIDSNGLHWAEVIWEAYTSCNVSVGKEIFRQAYVFAERTLGKNPIIQPDHTFWDMLYLKCEIQVQWLMDAGHLQSGTFSSELPKKLAEWCYYNYAVRSIEAARPLLEMLQSRYPMILVSNFYGNVETVLKDFHLHHLFPTIIESAVVGVRKPDPEIFRLGVEAIGLSAGNCVVIGDSYEKDILPAHAIGCQTVWLKSIGWEPYRGDEEADCIIEDFQQLKQVFCL